MLPTQWRWCSIAILMIGGLPFSAQGQDRSGLRQQLRDQRSPYSDPTLNMGPWSMMGGNRNMYLFSLAAQQRAAQQMMQEEMTTRGFDGRAQPSMHLQQPGGLSAGQFFGRTKLNNPQKEPAPLARYDRYRHYFGGGRN